MYTHDKCNIQYQYYGLNNCKHFTEKKMRNLGAHNFYLHLKENDRKNVEIAHNNTTFIMN